MGDMTNATEKNEYRMPKYRMAISFHANVEGKDPLEALRHVAWAFTFLDSHLSDLRALKVQTLFQIPAKEDIQPQDLKESKFGGDTTSQAFNPPPQAPPSMSTLEPAQPTDRPQAPPLGE